MSEVEGTSIKTEGIRELIVGDRNGGKYDLYKDRHGDLYIKPKGGDGPGEPTGTNINNFKQDLGFAL